MEVKEGMEVIVRGGFGIEVPEQVTVLSVDEKNGRKVFDYIDKGGYPRWAYVSQIVETVQA